jgi:CheY-like chemotaxis protein
MDVPLRLLIIEDSDDDAALVVRELKRAGYEVAFKRVDTPEMLKSAIAGQDWDLAISDFSMPQFSGTDALKLVRSMGCEAPLFLFQGRWAKTPRWPP